MSALWNSEMNSNIAVSTDETSSQPMYNEKRRIRPRNPTTSCISGILRSPTTQTASIEKRSRVDMQSLWKGLLLLFVPFAGSLCYQVVPYSLVLHFTVFCFGYGIVDLMEYDPTSTPMNRSIFVTNKIQRKRRSSLLRTINDDSMSSLTKDNGSISQRDRRVRFEEGTKFYRLPKPMSRRRREALNKQKALQQSADTPIKATQSDSKRFGEAELPKVCGAQHQEPKPTLKNNTTTFSVRSRGNSSTRANKNRSDLPTEANQIHSELFHPEPIDWEKANRLLKSSLANKNAPLARPSTPPTKSISLYSSAGSASSSQTNRTSEDQENHTDLLHRDQQSLSLTIGNWGDPSDSVCLPGGKKYFSDGDYAHSRNAFAMKQASFNPLQELNV